MSNISKEIAAMKLPTIAVDGEPKERLEAMAEAGERILECYRVLQKSDANVVGEVLKGQGEFFEWDHYPSGDVYDWESHSQYYYHAHPPENRANKWGAEHGHFHTFLRPKGMPKKIKPLDLPDFEPPEGENDALTHFVGISMDRAGYPIRIFTTTRWVTGEIWYAADDVIEMVDLFDIDQALPSWPVNIWITNMLRLFQPQIVALLERRDKSVADWEVSHPGINAYEDRNLEITSIIDISVEDQIKSVAKALKEPAA